MAKRKPFAGLTCYSCTSKIKSKFEVIVWKAKEGAWYVYCQGCKGGTA